MRTSFAAVLLSTFVALAPVAPLVLSPTSARAEQAAPSADTLAAASELLDASGASRQFEAVVPLMLAQMRQIFIGMSPAHEKDIREVVDEIGKRFIDRKQEVFDEIAKLYAARMSADELRQIAAFFKSGVGAKFVAMQPELVQESMVIGQRWGQRIGQEVEADVRRELKKRGVDL